MLKNLFCRHDELVLRDKHMWNPTYHTTNGIGDEEERLLVFECRNCGRRIEKKQIRSFGSLMNFKDIY